MTHVGTQPIETPRLWLRRFTPGDAPAMYQNWAGDAEVTRYLLWDAYQSEAETRANLEDILRRYEEPTFYRWAIEPKGLGQPVGSIAMALWPPEAGEPDWEAAYCLGRPWWGLGCTTEALCAAVGWFTAQTGITYIGCTHAVANPASGAVMRKAGFVYRDAGSYSLPDGTPVPSHNYLYQPEALCPTPKPND